MTWEDEFEQAPASAEPLKDLSDRVSALIEGGADREQVRQRLEAFHVQLADAGRDDDDDVVLEVLDFLTGWCNPSQRI
jgi:hypothetical protein